MKKVMLLTVLTILSQSGFAQDTATAPKLQRIEGCIYADIVYSVGEKHRVQQSVTDPNTNKITMVDVKPEIGQECMEDVDAGKTKSPLFYWRTLPN
jgi:hypothetical protein